MLKKIRVCEPSITELEKRYVKEALDKGFLSSTAPPVAEFENEYAKKFGTKYAIAVNSGGSSLMLAVWALGIGKGDEIILPVFTHIACANAVKICGAKPIFIDAEWDTTNINADLIEKKITPRTKAIMIAHMFGHPCDMDKIIKIAKKHKLYIIEDLSESHGALYKNKMTGSFGDMNCASLYANKIIATGEGGMITTNRGGLAEELKKLRAHYFDSSLKNRFLHKKVGFSFGLGALQAALGRAQLARLDELAGKRQENARYYNERLKDLVDIPAEKPYAKSVYWMYAIKVKDREIRDLIMDYLANEGVETRTLFFPFNKQPVYRTSESFPIAEKLGECGLYLPSGSDLSDEDKDFVCGKVREFFKKHAKKN